MTIMSEEPFEIPRFLRSPNAPAAGKRLPKNSQFVLGDVKTRERTPQVEGKGARRMKSATIRTKMSSIFRGVIGVLGILASAALITLAGLILFNNNLSDRTERGADNTPTTTLALALIRSPSANAANASPDHEIQRSDWSNQAARLQPEAEINAKSAPTEPTAQIADGTAQSVSDAAVPQVASAASPASPSVDSSPENGAVYADSSTPAPVANTDLATRGVTDHEIRFGMASPFTGANKEAGRQLKLGVDAAFDEINDAGGVNGRQLRLFAVDDGYEPSRTPAAMQELTGKDQVFGFIGNFGTATAAVALPLALEQKTLFLGALSGGNLLRRDPPDRYVFNYRPSYSEETGAAVRYLVKVRRI